MHTKIHYPDEHEALLKQSGHLINLIDGSSKSIKSASSSAITREMLEANKPDKDHFLLHVIAMGDEETYGCFFEGTPIQTVEGFKPIEDVVEGDLVLTDKNRYRKVAKTFMAPYQGGAVKIKCCGMAEPEVSTSKHPYKVVRKELFNADHRRNRNRPKGWSVNSLIDRLVDSAEYVDADSIRKGDFMVIPVGCSEPTHQLDMDFASVAGFYLAEGCVSRQGMKRGKTPMDGVGEPKAVIFTGHVDDEEQFNFIEDFQTSGGRTVSRNKSFTSDLGVRLQTCDRPLSKLLVILFGDSARTKHIHPVIFGQSEEWKLKFLASYFEGDGHLITGSKNPRCENTLTCSTSSANLAYDIQRLLASVGIRASSNLSFNKETNGCFGNGDLPIYSVSVGGSQSWRITDLCTRKKPITPTRGKICTSSAHTSGRYMLVPVDKIEVFPVDTWKYNIEVEEDNTFVTKVLGHNSNRNGDGWSKEANSTRHHTFVKEGAFYREHKHHDKKRDSIGIIKASAYNEDMGRIELAVWGRLRKVAGYDQHAEEEYEMAKSGKEISVSMSARLPFDVCSCCGNEAPNRGHYCSHLKTKMGQYIPEFDKFAFAWNPNPTFFDISKVKNPADRIAHHLEFMFHHEKAASTTSNIVIGGAERAELEGVILPGSSAFANAKHATLLQRLVKEERFFQEINKQSDVDAHVTLAKHASMYAYNEPVTESEIAKLKTIRPSVMIRELSKHATILPFEAFAAYALGLSAEEAGTDHRVTAGSQMLHHAFEKLADCGCKESLESAFEPASQFIAASDLNNDDEVQEVMDSVAAKHSIEPGKVEKQMIRIIISAPEEKAWKPVTVEEAKSASDNIDVENLVIAYSMYKLASLSCMQDLYGLKFIGPREITLTVGQNF